MQCKIHNPATYYRYNILDRRDWKFIPPPPSPQLRIGKQHALAFAQLHPRVFFFFGGGGGRGMVGLLFHFILSKIVVKIICGMGCERKNLYRQMSIDSKTG